MKVSEQIKQLRTRHGLTQEDLAAKAGLGTATVQRAEGGSSVSAATVASIAAAFGIHPWELTGSAEPPPTNDGPYLPLLEIRSGKQLVDMMAKSSDLDFDYMEIEDEATGKLVGRLHTFMSPAQSKVPSEVADRINLDIRATLLLKDMWAAGLSVSGATYQRTCYDVDDDGGGGMAIIFAEWEEACLVLRVGVHGRVINRANIHERLPRYTNINDSSVIYPEPESQSEESDHV